MSKIRLHGSSSGYTEIAPVAASGNNTITLPNDGTIISKDANGAVGVTSITVGTGVTIGDGRVTATSFVGSGANLTGVTALSGSTNDTVCTVTGANAIQGESNLTFGSDVLQVSSTTQGLGAKFVNTANEYTNLQFSAARTSADNALGIINAKWNNNHEVAAIYLTAGDDTGNKDDGRIKFYTSSSGGSLAQRLSIDNDGWIHVGPHSYNSPAASAYQGAAFGAIGFIGANRESDVPSEIGRTGTDGHLMRFYHAGTQEGNISVSGSTVSYNGGHLSRWSQLVGISTNVKSDRPTIYQGTVMSNLDAMCEWTGEDNQQLNKTKVSDVEGDKDVAGVFWTWDDDDDEYTNDFYVAMTGDMVIRVAASTTVARGDLLESAGDGTAKPQSDDIVRSKTVAKITSTTSTATYADGSKAYPCVLMAC